MGILQMVMSAVASALDPLILKRSTRFNDDDSAYLNRTPTSAGNRKTWTFSCWVKRAEFDTTWPALFTAGPSGTTSRTVIRFDYNVNGGEFAIFAGTMNLYTDGVLLDPAAWYHLVVAVDTTDQTAADRVKVYVNGTQRALSGTNAAPDEETYINSNELHRLGSDTYNTAWGCSASLADVNFVDGQQLTASYFGMTDATTGQWVPKIYTGSYGTNGFHLAMDPAESGTIYSDDISGSGAYEQYSNFAINAGRAFDSDTSTVCWADSATAVGSTGDLTWTPSSPIPVSSLKIYGAYHNNGVFKINGNSINSQLTAGSNGWRTITGIGTEISNISIHATSGSDTCSWGAIEVDGKILVNHTSIGNDSSGQNNDWYENNLWSDAAITWSDYIYGTVLSGFQAAWAFNGVASINHGDSCCPDADTTLSFIPPNVISGTTIEAYFRYNINGSGTATVTQNGNDITSTVSAVIPNDNDGAYITLPYNTIDTTNGLTWDRTAGGGKDYRLAAIRVDGTILQDGVVPDFVDLLADTPGAPYDNGLNGGGNYATLNPLDSATTLTNGNLTITGSGSAFKAVRSTIGMKTGKWYFEGKQVALASATSSGFGIWDDTVSTGNLNSGGGSYGNNYLAIMHYGGNISYVLGGSTTTIEAGSISDGDIFGFALDLDNGTLKVHQNGTYLNSGNSIYSTWPSDRTYFFGGYEYNSGNTLEFNFGARAFAHTPPTGYKSLNTYNLTATIADPSDHFDVGLNDGPNILTTALGLTDGADFVWIKDRDNDPTDHILFNRINDPNMDGDPHLISNDTDTEASLGAYSAPQGNSVAWVWNAGTTNTLVSVGDLNSSVYDQSYTWSSTFVSASGSWWSGYDNTKAFDGDPINTESGTNASSVACTFTIPVGYRGTNRVWMVKVTDKDQISVDGSVVRNEDAGRGSADNWYTLASTNPTSIAIYSTTTSSNLRGVKADGKLLVDSNVTPPDAPSIPSTYRANTAAGFSCVSYSGSGSTDTISHGLSSPPQFIIAKNRENTFDWGVYHVSAGPTVYLKLNLSDSASPQATWQNTAPDLSMFYVGNYNSVNQGPGEDYTAYCWTSVPGYSKFGSYEGTGVAATGPFVHLGFQPAIVLVKNLDANSSAWTVWDNKRPGYNLTNLELRLSNEKDETESAVNCIDILSNGFRLRGSDSQSNSSDTFVYAAWASSPFKYSNAY